MDVHFDATVHCRGLKVDVMLDNIHCPVFSHTLSASLLGQILVSALYLWEKCAVGLSSVMRS